MSRDVCRLPGCDHPARGRKADVDGFGGRFCSDRCEVYWEHLRSDAKDAERADRAAAEGRGR